MKPKKKPQQPTTTIQRVTVKPDDLAKMLGTSRATVYAGLRNGRIPSRRIGKRFIIPRAAIDEWLRSSGSAELREL